MGYTGRGYTSTARSPYGYGVSRRPDDVWSSGEKDSCDLLVDAAIDCRDLGDPSRALVELLAKRSRPQSLVKSHQNEYDELMTTDISLIECKVGEVIQRRRKTNIPETKKWVFAMPSLLGPVSLR